MPKDATCPNCNVTIRAGQFCRRCGSALPGRVTDALQSRARHALRLGILSNFIPLAIVLIIKPLAGGVGSVTLLQWFGLLTPVVNWLVMIFVLVGPGSK
jgi:hypothetical protein